jgi:hypothetical protein
MPRGKNKKQKVEIVYADLQPDELGKLRETIKEYVDRKQVIRNEIETLLADEKQLAEDFSDRLDIRTMRLVEAHFKLQAKIMHKDTFDLFVETLKDESL